MKVVWGKEPSQKNTLLLLWLLLWWCLQGFSEASATAGGSDGQWWDLTGMQSHFCKCVWWGWQQYSSSRSQWDSCFFLFLTREKGRTSNSFATESLTSIWWGGCHPLGSECLSFAFVDWIFLGENLLKWLYSFAVSTRKGCPTKRKRLLWIFTSVFCASGLCKIVLVSGHSALFFFI